MGDNLGILLSAKLDEILSTKNINEQLKKIQSKLEPILLKIEGFDPKIFSELTTNIKNIGNQLNETLGGNVWIEKFGGNLRLAITKVETEAKKGLLTFDELEKKLLEIRNVYGQVGAFNGDIGIKNDKLMTDALIRSQKKIEDLDKSHYQAIQEDARKNEKELEAIEKQYTQFLESERKREYDIDRAHYQAFTEDARRADKDKRVIDKEYTQSWSQNLKQQEALDKAHYMALRDDAKRTEDALKSTTKSALSFGDAFQTAIVKFPIWMAATTAFYGTLRFFTDGVKYVNELNKSLTEISIVQGYNQQKVEQLGLEYQKLGMEMSVTTAELTKGAVELYRQGMNDTQVMERLKTVTEYAKISNLDFKDSVEIITATVNSMGVSAVHASDVFSKLGRHHCPLAS